MKLCCVVSKIWARWKCMVSSWRSWEKGAVRYLPPSCCFYIGSQSPPDQSWFIERGWGGGRQASSLAFCARQQRQTGAEPFKHTTHTYKTHNGWFCRSLAALRGPSSHPGQDWIQTSPSNSLPCLSAFLEQTDGQTYRRLRLLPRKARWIYKVWQYWAGGILFRQEEHEGLYPPSKTSQASTLMWLRGAVTAEADCQVLPNPERRRGEKRTRIRSWHFTYPPFSHNLSIHVTLAFLTSCTYASVRHNKMHPFAEQLYHVFYCVWRHV